MDRRITLTDDEALVLLEWLATHNEADDLPGDQAEHRALWNLEATLEKVVTETFLPEYSDLVTAAKHRLLQPSTEPQQTASPSLRENAVGAQTVACIEDLVREFPSLKPVLDEQVEDNFGEFLPHLILSDVVRHLASAVESDRGVVESVWQWLARRYEQGSEDVRDLIVVSGVEMIPDQGETGAEMREMLSERLRAFDPWR